MLKTLMRTDDHVAGLILRLALGIVMFPHGAQKVLGWFGGGGISGTFEFFQSALGIPAFLTALVMLTEFVGSLLLVAGALTRVAALATGINMLVAALLVHVPNGFFMNWSGQQAGEGFEFHILAIGLAATLTVVGGGTLSVDRAVTAGEDLGVAAHPAAPSPGGPAGG